MRTGILVYGANGYVGREMARRAVENGMDVVVGGRNVAEIERLGEELGVPARVVGLNEPAALERALGEVSAVLHCAGPFVHTARAMVEACLRTGTHYLDITGEIPVLEEIAMRDADARARGVMLLPAVGFDVVPTDCLACYLKARLPTATHLALAFQTKGPAGLPPGTQRTAIEMARYGIKVREDGELRRARGVKTRAVDMGQGRVAVTRLTWGDVFTAYYSTGIPNIEVYAALSRRLTEQLKWMGRAQVLFRVGAVRSAARRVAVRPGPPAEARARTVTHVWGEVRDEKGRTARARLHGPEPGVEWTVQTGLAAARRVLAGDAPPGFQTPARAYGAELVMDGQGVTREDIP